MNPWLESLLCMLGSFAALFVAWRIRSLCLVWFGAGIVGIFHALWNGPDLFHRTSGMTMSLAVPLVIGPLYRFPMSRFLKYGITIASSLTILFSGWMEFLAPALARGELRELKTLMSGQGVCLQTTDYTCGPAAAVTLLRMHGFPAEEGDLALLAKASLHTGADAPGLVAAIERRFGSAGVTADMASDQTYDELARAGECLAVVPADANTDHWVAVLKATDDEVFIADPLQGMKKVKRAKFEQSWRREIVRIHFSRQGPLASVRN